MACCCNLFIFLSSIVVFLLSKKITEDHNISLLASALYSIHYSITIKSLSWNIFYGHIANALLGFLSIFLLILFIERNKRFYLFFYILLSVFGSMIYESGLIFPIIAFCICFIRYKKNLFKHLFLSLSPIIIYIALVFIFTGKFLPIFTERLQSERSDYYYKIYVKDPKKDELHFYRSNYAPRDIKGYSLRFFDNTLSTINFSSFEKILKYYDRDKKIKSIIKQNIYSFILFSIIFLTIFIFCIIKKIQKIKNIDILKKIFLLHIIVFFIYTFIFFRKDINIALSFTSVLIISVLIVNFYKMGAKVLAYIMLTAFIVPSLLYAKTGFEFYGDFGPRKNINKNFVTYDTFASQGKLDKNMEGYDNYKYLFYYKNYDKYEKYLSKYKNMPLRQFTEKFYANE